MARNTYGGYIRQCGSGKSLNGATPAPVVSALTVTGVDATQASAAAGVTLPKGARVLDVLTNGKGTGGTSPTIDIGTATNDDAFVAEGDADGGLKSSLAAGVAGSEVLNATALAADTPVYAGKGASAATGGTFDFTILFVMEDDGALQD